MKQQGSQYNKNWASGAPKTTNVGFSGTCLKKLKNREMLIFHPISTTFVSKMIRISRQIEWCKNKKKPIY